jgi:hypothetical protein
MKIVALTALALTLAAAPVRAHGPATTPEPIAMPEPAPAPAPSPAPAVDPDREALRELLAARRALQIERLVAYRKAALFPRNRVRLGIINVFRDEAGLLCAVANMIFLDGRLALVARTAKENNHVQMGKLTSGPLHDWILTSGFTIEEIAAIQLPDRPIGHGIDWEELENARIIAHLERVEERLARDTETSLNAAVDRLIDAGLGA